VLLEMKLAAWGIGKGREPLRGVGANGATAAPVFAAMPVEFPRAELSWRPVAARRLGSLAWPGIAESVVVGLAVLRPAGEAPLTEFEAAVVGPWLFGPVAGIAELAATARIAAPVVDRAFAVPAS
jgi:hypothetical protein